MFRLIPLAPKLQAVDGMCFLSNVREKSIRPNLITGICILPIDKEYEALDALARGQPKLKNLKIMDCTLKSKVIPPLWTPLLLELFQKCSRTLVEISICSLKLLELRTTNYGLDELEVLNLYFPEYSYPEEFRNILASLRLQEFCPRLSSLRLDFGEECIHELPTSLSIDGSALAPVESVREVTTRMAVCLPAVVETCTTTFPYLCCFAFQVLPCADTCEHTDKEHWYDVYKIWTEIPTLQELRLGLPGTDATSGDFSIDALLCGLRNEEARRLKSLYNNNPLELANFQFCPSRPSLVYAKSKSLVYFN